MMMHGETLNSSEGEIKVSFGYHCNCENDSSWDRPNYIDIPSSGGLRRANSSFSCLSGAALSANATLANTNIGNGLIASEILPTLDSPNSFRRIPSLTKMDLLSSSLQSSMSILSYSPSSPSEALDYDPSTLVAGKVKGKLKVTRAFGVGYLKTKDMNDALMGILRVRNLISPPYVSVQPSLIAHEVSDSDHFVVLGSDGLFDFFSNDEVVNLVHSYALSNPSGDPAKFLVEQLAARAADSAGFSMEELMSIPAGRRRKYHDDVTVIVIFLGTNKRTSKASTCL